MTVTINDYSEEALEAFNEACLRALERCGNEAKDIASDLAPYRTGNLSGRIAQTVVDSEPSVHIGTNVEYAGYVEFGTGSYSSIGGGTPKTHWAYMGEDGEWHIGKPQKPKPFLKPAVANHKGTYKNIFADELSKMK